jgi:hypothetical protein
MKSLNHHRQVSMIDCTVKSLSEKTTLSEKRGKRSGVGSKCSKSPLTPSPRSTARESD